MTRGILMSCFMEILLTYEAILSDARHIYE